MAEVINRKQLMRGLVPGQVRGMTDDKLVLAHSPESDCNSNTLDSTASNTSSVDFIQDNSDYQWCIDYGYRESHHHASILSSLSASYEVGRYDDLARDIDSQLAQVDMEDFRAEDILPAMCCGDLQPEFRGEMFASVSGSMMVKFDFDSSLSPLSSSQEESMAICKSEPLFSPVRETPMPGNISVDSLDCEQDMLLTCQANKDNYTIAFEGSTMMGVDSDYHDTGESGVTSTYSSEGTGSASGSRTSCMRVTQLKGNNANAIAMTNSDAPFTTWSKLKKHSNERNSKCNHPPYNNNVLALKQSSLSLPNLYNARNGHWFARNIINASSIENRALGLGIALGGCVKLYDVQNTSSSLASDSANTNSGSSLSSGGLGPPQRTQNFSLVRLFIKQRSGSSNAMDQSAASDYNYTSSEHDARRNTSRSLNEFECRETLCDNRPQTRLKKYNTNILATDNLRNKNEINSEDTKEWITGYEDSLVDGRSHDLITEEEEDVSDSVERLTESDSKGQTDSVSVCSCDGSLSMSRAKFSINNNNSFERIDIRSPVAHLKRGTQTHLSQSDQNQSSDGSSTSSDPTNATQIPVNINNQRVRNSGTQCPVHCQDKCMQTSASLQANIEQKNNSNNINCNRQTTSPNSGPQDKNNYNSTKKPVYVLYPNYTLPDLEFLRDCPTDLEQIFLTPIRFSPGWTPPTTPPPPMPSSKPGCHKTHRPFSSAELDELRKKGFGHVLDWESLTFLLPREYYQLLQDVPEIRQHGAGRLDNTKPLFCVSPTSSKSKPSDFAPFPDARTTVNVSSSSSTATQPSSGYRGSSTLLTDSGPNPSPGPIINQNPLFVYRYDSISSESGLSGPPLPKRSISLPEDKNGTLPAPPRPPLPRGILRNTLENTKTRKNTVNKKRYSMFELGIGDCEELSEVDTNKRKSLPNNIVSNNCNRKNQNMDAEISSDEGVGAEWWGDIPRPPTPPTTHALRLQHLLEMSGSDHWDQPDVDALRAQVSRFLSQAGRKSVSFADNGENVQQGMTPPNSPQNSLAQRTYQCKLQGLGEAAIREENEGSISVDNRFRSADKTDLVEAVSDSVQRLLSCEQQSIEMLSQHSLNSLCPALYALLSDGLKPTIETPFGDINNSVWQVIEASSQQGPMTKALNELVVKLNSEDVLTEGVVKFNAFIFGLLNVQGLDVWLSYLRTRESVLRKHYLDDGLLLTACQGNAKSRALSDHLLTSLKNLTQISFKLDPLYETRQLHQSLLQLGRVPLSPSHSGGSSTSSKSSWTLRKLVHSIQSGLGTTSEEEPTPTQEVCTARPRSCVDSVGGFSVVSDIASTVRKRWSGIHIGSKLANAFERLAPDDTEEDYTDSLETGVGPCGSHEGESDDTDGSGGGKFRRLQMKWEMLSGRDTPVSSTHTSPSSSPVKSSTPRSRIPRPVTSPVRPPVSAQSPSSTSTQSPARNNGAERPVLKKPLSLPSQLRKPAISTARSKMPEPVMPVRARARPSRMDLPAKGSSIPAVRPSSLPYRSSPSRPAEAQRRAASSSTVRKPPQDTSSNHKYVVTLTHRLPSDSGHLAFNEGERLRLVLDVDDTWLLCCRDDHKGLVPRSAVIPVHN
ncbi:uncharacterized protein LOC142330581 isoform X2 [Lycorma delicatula]|uniref:uncharacterized protein LOC142330581 isoform X2 n=1 Tax=Lycorma delicatula TaxID=130591 RepID=UPI003F5140EF